MMGMLEKLLAAETGCPELSSLGAVAVVTGGSIQVVEPAAGAATPKVVAAGGTTNKGVGGGVEFPVAVRARLLECQPALSAELVLRVLYGLLTLWAGGWHRD